MITFWLGSSRCEAEGHVGIPQRLGKGSPGTLNSEASRQTLPNVKSTALMKPKSAAVTNDHKCGGTPQPAFIL